MRRRHLRVRRLLAKKFKRRQTGKTNWDEAKAVVAAWEAAGTWDSEVLRIKAFFGASENAVKAQIRIAVPVYVLVAIVR